MHVNSIISSKCFLILLPTFADDFSCSVLHCKSTQYNDDQSSLSFYPVFCLAIEARGKKRGLRFEIEKLFR